MEPLPGITISSWEDTSAGFRSGSQRSTRQSRGLSSPSCIDVPQLDGNLTLKKSKSDVGMRKSFWSKLKRSKSSDGHRLAGPSSAQASNPQPAMPGNNLVWSEQQQIWLFPNEPANPYKPPHRTEDRLRPRSSNGCGGDLLFGQVPGHYPLSPYDSINGDQDPPSYARGGHFNDVARKTGTESQWTLVARRVSESAATRPR
jgi:hypothetical protein